MAASKFIALVSGRLKEIVATVSSAGAADDGKIVALDNTGRLDSSVMPVGLGDDTKSIQASESLGAGNLVNLWNSAGEFRVRKADATQMGKEAHGFVLSSVSSGDQATVFFEGTNTSLAGLTPGRYYLATTPGEVTSVPPIASGNVVQYVGNAVTSTEIAFEATEGVILA